MHHQHNNQQKASLLIFFIVGLIIDTLFTTTTTTTCHHHKQQPRTMPVVTSPSTTTNGKLHAHLLSECYGINGDTPDNRTAAQPQFFLVMKTRDGWVRVRSIHIHVLHLNNRHKILIWNFMIKCNIMINHYQI